MQQQLAHAIQSLLPSYMEADDWDGLTHDLAIYILRHVDDDVASDIMNEIIEDAKSLAS